MIVQLAGLPGVGKTTLAAELLRHLHSAFLLNKDQIRHAVFDPQHIQYTAAQDDLCAELMLQAAAWQLQQDPSTTVILDGPTCSRASQIQRLHRFTDSHGQLLRLIECVCDDHIALTRLRRDHAAGQHLAANRTPDLYHLLRARAEPIPQPKLILDTNAPVPDCLTRALPYITQPQASHDHRTAPAHADEDTALLEVAHAVIGPAESYLLAHRPTNITAKADRDTVTDVDLAIERQIRTTLATRTPAIPLLGEEEGAADAIGNGATYWVLDPIDGTANFTRGIPLTGIALALIRNHQPALGVIALPFLNHRYWAAAGRGAWRNGHRIHAATTAVMADAVVAIGDYATGPDAEPRNRAALALHDHLAPRVQRIRMLGSAAADLAWVADGRLDASLTLSNRPWDTAAGAVIAHQAGAVLLDIDGTPHTTTAQVTLATTPALRADILAAVQHAVTTTSFATEQDTRRC